MQRGGTEQPSIRLSSPVMQAHIHCLLIHIWQVHTYVTSTTVPAGAWLHVCRSGMAVNA